MAARVKEAVLFQDEVSDRCQDCTFVLFRRLRKQSRDGCEGYFLPVHLEHVDVDVLEG